MDRFAVAALTLIDGTTSIPIRPLNATAGDPIFCVDWDLGAPEIRVTTTPRSGSDGTVETSGYLGARTVTMTLKVRGDGAGVAGGHDPYWYIDQLTGMCHPSRRPTLKIQRRSEGSGGLAWYLGLRGNPWSLTYQRSSAAIIDLALNFTAPLGYFESELHTVVSRAGNKADMTDWHFPAHFPKGFGPSVNSPFLTAEVVGSTAVTPILYITGPVTNPKLRDSSGAKFDFTGLSLAAGQTIQIDMGAGTVLKADPETGVTNPASDVFHLVDFNVSTFWVWQPGTHRVAFLADSGTFAIQWRDRKLSV